MDERYFATLGVPLLHGRNFSSADTASTPKVAIVNESFVRRYWPGEDALGRRFRTQAIDGPEYQVVGVVADYKVDTVGENRSALHPLRPRTTSVHRTGPDGENGR